MQMRALGIGFVLLLVAGCGRSGMSLSPTFEEKARAIPIVRDQEPPRTTHLAFGSTRVENFVFSSGRTSTTSHLSSSLSTLTGFVSAAGSVVRESSRVAGVVDASVERDETSELSFELSHARERFTTTCESTLGFGAADGSLERSALVCSITTSKGVSFTLEMESRGGVQGRILRSLDPRNGPLFELEGRGGSVLDLAGFSVRRGGAEVAAVELPHAVSEPNAWVTGALLDEEKAVVLASFAAITSVRWPGDTPPRTAR
jgi:hypothetical protein